MYIFVHCIFFVYIICTFLFPNGYIKNICPYRFAKFAANRGGNGADQSGNNIGAARMNPEWTTAGAPLLCCRLTRVTGAPAGPEQWVWGGGLGRWKANAPEGQGRNGLITKLRNRRIPPPARPLLENHHPRGSGQGVCKCITVPS